MKNLISSSTALTILVFALAATSSAQHFVVTNDDSTGANTATIFKATGTPTNPSLTKVKTIQTGGQGLGGGYFAINSINVVSDASGNCAYIANAGSNDITGYDSTTDTVTGPFSGSPGDSSGTLGMSLAVGGNFLYADFTESHTLGTFQISSGCQLTFVGDISTPGLNGGSMDGMKIHGNLMVVAYGDGSYSSFNISGGTPVPNNDKQLSTGYQKYADEPAGVDISANGNWAILGDATNAVDIEVAPISSSGVGKTIAYANLENASNSNSVWLSPDNTLIYVTNTYSGQVSAYGFDPTTGAVRFGCISAVLNKYDEAWEWDGAVQTAGTSGTGSLLWIAEFGTPSSLPRFDNPGLIGMVEVTKSGGTCTLTEAPASPVTDSNSHGLLTVAAFPPRSF